MRAYHPPSVKKKKKKEIDLLHIARRWLAPREVFSSADIAQCCTRFQHGVIYKCLMSIIRELIENVSHVTTAFGTAFKMLSTSILTPTRDKGLQAYGRKGNAKHGYGFTYRSTSNSREKTFFDRDTLLGSRARKWFLSLEHVQINLRKYV